MLKYLFAFILLIPSFAMSLTLTEAKAMIEADDTYLLTDQELEKAAIRLMESEQFVNDCTATAFLTDFADGFSNQNDAFDWCFKRVEWWGLDTRNGWKDRFCRTSRYNVEYDQFKWRGQFWHEFKKYSARYPSQLFYQFDDDFSYRLFQGWSGRIQFQFGDRCGY